jgi:hypothetical protein
LQRKGPRVRPQAMQRRLPRTLLYQTTITVKRESNPLRPIA